MTRVQKEVSKEGQEGVREKSLQCGARWGENGKGQGALRVQGVGARGEGPEGAARVQSQLLVGEGYCEQENLKSNDLNVTKKKTPSNGEQSSSTSGG